jgi:hypothetical protein
MNPLNNWHLPVSTITIFSLIKIIILYQDKSGCSGNTFDALSKITGNRESRGAQTNAMHYRQTIVDA